jgi:hypothetical protein
MTQSIRAVKIQNEFSNLSSLYSQPPHSAIRHSSKVTARKLNTNNYITSLQSQSCDNAEFKQNSGEASTKTNR